MAFQVTQCPHCESTFHTNPRILEMAAGKVRCGACLTVFLAEDHFLSQPELDIDDAEQESVFIGNDPAEFFDPSVFISRTALKSDLADSAPTQIETPSAAEPQQELEQPDSGSGAQHTVFELPDPPPPAPEQEDEHFSQPDLSPESEMLEAQEAQEAQTGETGAAESAAHQEFFAAIDASLGPYGEADDISDLEEIAAMEPPTSRPTPEQPGTEPPGSGAEAPERNAETQDRSWSDNTNLSVSFAMDFSRTEVTTAAKDYSDSDSESENQAQEITQISSADKDDNLEDLVRQAIAEQDFSAAVEAGMQEPLQQPAPAENILDDFVDDQATEIIDPDGGHDTEEDSQADDPEPELSTEAIRARALQQELRDEDALDEIPAEHLASLKRIATPVELSGARQRSWGSRICMLGLILLLGAALAGQYLWRYRDNYSVDPRFRMAYQFVCDQYQAITGLSCDLPQYSEIAAIRSDNLAVRSHPQREDGLMVTVELRNTASFPQPFPVLILGFNSASNEVIALREFAPGEYLDPGLRQIELMPVASPVQVSLPIMDPGEDAINYTLAFRTR